METNQGSFESSNQIIDVDMLLNGRYVLKYVKELKKVSEVLEAYYIPDSIQIKLEFKEWKENPFYYNKYRELKIKEKYIDDFEIVSSGAHLE